MLTLCAEALAQYIGQENPGPTRLISKYDSIVSNKSGKTMDFVAQFL